MVSKSFGSLPSKIDALVDINLTINRNEFIAIRGPSGSGKTTLLMVLGGMMQPSSGIIKISKQDIYTLDIIKRCRFRASNIGFVFQMFYLIPYLNVLENIMVSTGMGVNKSTQLKALELVDKLGISERIQNKPSEISAGERQRVALGRALINKPQIILADEPTGNLDHENSLMVMNTLANYHHEGGTVIVVTHGDDANPFADKIVYLNKGAIVRNIETN